MDPFAFKQHSLKSGLRVFHQRRDIPWVLCLLWVNAGEIDDPEGKPGIAHLTEHLLFRGFGDYPQMDDILDLVYWAAERDIIFVTPLVGHHTTQVGCRAEFRMIEQALRLIHAFMFLPHLDTGLEHELKVIQRERDEKITKRLRDAEKKRLKAFFGSHPLSQTGRFPEDKLLFSSTLDDVRRYHTRMFDIRNANLALIGDTPWGKLRPIVKRVFQVKRRRAWSAPKIPQLKLKPPKPRKNIVLCDDDGSGETIDINYHWIMPPQDRFALVALQECLDTLFNKVLRDELKLCYEVDMTYDMTPLYSELSVSITVDSSFANVERARQAIHGILKDGSGIVDILPAEIHKHCLDLRLDIHEIEDVLDELMTSVTRIGCPLSLKEIIAGIRAVTENDVLKILRNHITPRLAFVEIVEGE